VVILEASDEQQVALEFFEQYDLEMVTFPPNPERDIPKC
jgi:hypothetical protein